MRRMAFGFADTGNSSTCYETEMFEPDAASRVGIKDAAHRMRRERGDAGAMRNPWLWPFHCSALAPAMRSSRPSMSSAPKLGRCAQPSWRHADHLVAGCHWPGPDPWRAASLCFACHAPARHGAWRPHHSGRGRAMLVAGFLSVFVTHSSSAILFDVGVRLHQSRTSQFSPSTGWEVASLYHSISVARAGFALSDVVPVPAKGLRRKLKRVGALVVR